MLRLNWLYSRKDLHKQITLLVLNWCMLVWKLNSQKRGKKKNGEHHLHLSSSFSLFPFLSVEGKHYRRHHLLHIWAGHHSTSGPTGTSVTLSPRARIPGSTGRWRRCRGSGRGGTCSSSRWRSLAARSTCRSSAPLFHRHLTENKYYILPVEGRERGRLQETRWDCFVASSALCELKQQFKEGKCK